ncbi:subtilisin-like protease SBT3 [Phaseolus vulgaris]|uniref:subtilisin-like protease SBT3 n=1 Tax=Phaseolus vulgaris TaxID=3885 RepID=UPI0035CB566F
MAKAQVNPLKGLLKRGKRPSLDLNYPSFIAFFSSNSSRTVQEFQRTVTNVGEGPASYAANFTSLEGYRVSVTPELLVFKEKYEKLSYTLRIEGPRTKKEEKEVDFGHLTWTNGKYVVRSPIVVTILRFHM